MKTVYPLQTKFVGGKKSDLISVIICSDNVTNEQSAPSFSKKTLSIIQLKSDAKGDNNVKGVYWHQIQASSTYSMH